MNKHLDRFDDDDIEPKAQSIEESMMEMAKSIAKMADSLDKSLERYEAKHDELIRTIQSHKEESTRLDNLYPLVESLVKDAIANERNKSVFYTVKTNGENIYLAPDDGKLSDIWLDE